MSSYTIPEVIDLVIHAGGKPYFIDFNKDSTYFDISSLQSKMKLKPAAIIITHYNVNQISYEKISEIVKQNDSILIEDSALSISGKSKNINIDTPHAVICLTLISTVQRTGLVLVAQH